LVAAVVCAAAVSVMAAGAAWATTTGLINQPHKIASIQSRVGKLLPSGRYPSSTELAAICGSSASPRQVFRSWGDLAWYTPAPGGSLEDTTNWTFNSRAWAVPQNNTFSSGTQSLFLGQNGQAITPAMCVSTSDPTVRFFVKNTVPGSTLKVSVLYEGLDGNVHQLRLANLTAGSGWQPSLVIPYYINMLAAASPTGVTAVAFQFDTQNISTSSGGWTIDDIYLDPVKIR